MDSVEHNVVAVIIDRYEHVSWGTANRARAIRIGNDNGAANGATILLNFLFCHILYLLDLSITIARKETRLMLRHGMRSFPKLKWLEGSCPFGSVLRRGGSPKRRIKCELSLTIPFGFFREEAEFLRQRKRQKKNVQGSPRARFLA